MGKRGNPLAIMLILASAGTTFAADTTYVVKKGDTSAKIGKVYGVAYMTIVQKNSIINPNFIYVMKDYASIVQIGMGGTANLETVATLGKNNVAIIPERFKSQAEQFEKIGVKAVIALPNSEGFDTIKSSLTIVGKVLGENSKASQINAFIDKNIAEAEAISAKAKAQPSALFLGSSSPFPVASTSMIQTDIIAMAGGKKCYNRLK